MDELRRLLSRPRSVTLEALRVTGLIYLVTAGAALPFIVIGVEGVATSLLVLALIGVPVVAGGLVVVPLLVAVYLLCLPIRPLIEAGKSATLDGKVPGVWDRKFDGSPGGEPCPTSTRSR